MTDKNFFALVCALIVAGLVLVGCIGGDCVADCEKAGNSSARCFNICRP